LKTDFGGLPIAFHLTGGEASDNRNFDVLLDIGPDINPRAALGDKGYDSKSNREAARQRGVCPAIPHRCNTKDIPSFRRFSTKLVPVSSKQWESSNDSSASHYDARRQRGTMVRLLRSPSALS
jgi:hypothetical protein